MTRIVATLVLTTIGALAAGCGGSNSKQVTKAQAVAYAHFVNLRAADVPHLVVAEQPVEAEESAAGPLGPEVEKCNGGVAEGQHVIRVGSQRFERGDVRHGGKGGSATPLPIEDVQSAIYFMGSAALAVHEFAALDSSRARACFQRTLEAENAKTVDKGEAQSRKELDQPMFRKIQLSALPSPLRGVRAYGLRWRACFTKLFPTCTPSRSEYVVDYLGFVIGSALITLHDTGIPHAFSPATERRLLSLLYSRAEAHGLDQAPPTSKRATADRSAPLADAHRTRLPAAGLRVYSATNGRRTHLAAFAL